MIGDGRHGTCNQFERAVVESHGGGARHGTIEDDDRSRHDSKLGGKARRNAGDRQRNGRRRRRGILRIDFPEAESDEGLEQISWDEFFEKFDEAGLEFLYQDKAKDGKLSRFNKFVRKPR